MSRLLEAIRAIESRKLAESHEEAARTSDDDHLSTADSVRATPASAVEKRESPIDYVWQAPPHIPTAQAPVFSQPWPDTPYQAPPQPEQATYRAAEQRVRRWSEPSAAATLPTEPAEHQPTASPEPKLPPVVPSIVAKLDYGIANLARNAAIFFRESAPFTIGLLGFDDVDYQWHFASQLASAMSAARPETVVAVDAQTLRTQLSTVADLRRRAESFVVNCGLADEPGADIYASACDLVLLLITLDATRRRDALAAIKRLNRRGAANIKCVAIAPASSSDRIS
jgi:hypothetical protein